MIHNVIPERQKQVALDWYKKLSPDQKIGFKTFSLALTGVEFSSLSFLFNYIEMITILYNKLLMEEIL